MATKYTPNIESKTGNKQSFKEGNGEKKKGKETLNEGKPEQKNLTDMMRKTKSPI